MAPLRDVSGLRDDFQIRIQRRYSRRGYVVFDSPFVWKRARDTNVLGTLDAALRLRIAGNINAEHNPSVVRPLDVVLILLHLNAGGIDGNCAAYGDAHLFFVHEASFSVSDRREFYLVLSRSPRKPFCPQASSSRSRPRPVVVLPA